MMQAMLDGFVKSPDATLRFILRHCGVHQSTPHSSGFARLACGLFTKPSHSPDFYGFLRCRHAGFRSISDGFTLLEVMIAMAILAITLVAVFQSQSQSISMAGDSRFLTTASLLAQSRMVEIDTADPKAVTAGNGDFGEDFPDYRWQVEIGDTEIDVLKKISLTVTNSRMVVRNSYRLILYKVVLR